MMHTPGKVSLVACCSVLMLAGCSLSGGPQITEISSSDGIASINLAGVILPDGIKAKDIRIESIPTDAEEGLQAGVAYDLLPDGITFDQPVTVTLSLPPSEDRIIPFVMHSTATDTEVVDSVTITEDLASNTMTIEAEIDHFSKIWTTKHGFKVEAVGGGEYAVGTSAPITITVSPTGSQVGIRNRETKRYRGADIKEGTTYSVGSIKFHNIGFGKQPLRIDTPSIPGKKDLPLTKGTMFSNTFYCAEEGKGRVQTTMGIEYTIEYYPDRGYANVNPKKKEGKGGASYIIMNDYTCVEGMMVQIGTPYLFICPNGESRSGTYMFDSDAGEYITNAAGEKLDTKTGQPIPPCPPMR